MECTLQGYLSIVIMLYPIPMILQSDPHCNNYIKVLFVILAQFDPEFLRKVKIKVIIHENILLKSLGQSILSLPILYVSYQRFVTSSSLLYSRSYRAQIVMSTFLCIVTSYVYSDELCSELYVFNKTMMAFRRPLIVASQIFKLGKGHRTEVCLYVFLLFKNRFLTVNVLYNVKDFNPPRKHIIVKENRF